MWSRREKPRSVTGFKIRSKEEHRLNVSEDGENEAESERQDGGEG